MSLWALFFILFRLPLSDLLRGAIHNDQRYSHVFFIPLISACVVYFKRRSVFPEVRYCPSWGVPALALALTLYWVLGKARLFPDPNDFLSCAVAALVLFWVAAFLLCYGVKALRAATFPLCFLLFMIPMPTFLLDTTVAALQRTSADVTQVLFKLAGLPVVWQGLEFSLGGAHFEIAEGCSGIRSTLVLFIASILVGRIFLRSLAGRVCLSLLTVLVAIFKNAVRIVTLSYLSVYVDHSYYFGWLHRDGGFPFSLLALAILVPSLLALQRGETYAVGRRQGRAQLSPPSET